MSNPEHRNQSAPRAEAKFTIEQAIAADLLKSLKQNYSSPEEQLEALGRIHKLTQIPQ